MIEKSDSKQLSLATTSILGQAPSDNVGLRCANPTYISILNKAEKNHKTKGIAVNDNSLLLQQLLDIKQPEISFWWPLAPGWWFLIVALLFVLRAAFWYWYQGKQLRRVALLELHSLKQSFLSDRDTCRLAMNITLLLRRVALAKYERESVAGLSGNKWLEFLNVHGNTLDFTQGAGLILLHAPYQNKWLPEQDEQFNEQPLIKLAHAWIRSNT